MQKAEGRGQNAEGGLKPRHAAFFFLHSALCLLPSAFGPPLTLALIAVFLAACATVPSPTTYDGWQKSSLYVPTRDGTRLAMDLFRPTRAGVLHADKLPVVWTATRYRRAVAEGGEVYTMLDDSTWLQDLLRHGYVVAAVDVRGSGASFGTFEGMFNGRETEDSYDVTEWLAAQPWSNGRIGMYGRSYLGITQYRNAGLAPPHLAAIFPEVAMGDLYGLLWPGGISHSFLIEAWSERLKKSDTERPAMPVDGPDGEALLRQALAAHQANVNMGEIAQALPFRDSTLGSTGIRPYLDWSPFTHRAAIARSHVAIHHLGGWFDRYIRDQLLLYRNLPNPQKLVIGPWSHVQDHDFDFSAAHLRFYDRWLKGIDNGVMDEPPIRYYTLGAGWRTATTWPLPQQQLTPFPLGADGTLGRQSTGTDALPVDYTATVTPSPRWSNAATWDEASRPRGLRYETAPLEAPMEITGHPIVHLTISTTAPDADVFVYLEEVDAAGTSHYLCEGALRSSHRALATPDFESLGLPYHRHYAEDVLPVPANEPMALTFDLTPISNIVDRGHRLRLTITGADAANARTPNHTPAPTLTVHRATSRIVLPIIP